ncbi:hypothetical protein [Frankia sp. AiPa1]|nr:hypothetical protein [Frankia sp. AiPa1]MCL9759479.1 hypothetical protein [Frankia sp. AiPa1]
MRARGHAHQSAGEIEQSRQLERGVATRTAGRRHAFEAQPSTITVDGWAA